MVKSTLSSGILILLLSVGTNVSLVAAPQKAADPVAGKKLFLQRCSICHMPQRPAPEETLGPHLEGLFESGDQAATEALVRQMILTGIPGRPGVGMPSFKYGLDSGQIDNIVAFLKTFKKGDVPKRSGGDVENGGE